LTGASPPSGAKQTWPTSCGMSPLCHKRKLALHWIRRQKSPRTDLCEEGMRRAARPRSACPDTRRALNSGVDRARIDTRQHGAEPCLRQSAGPDSRCFHTKCAALAGSRLLWRAHVRRAAGLIHRAVARSRRGLRQWLRPSRRRAAGHICELLAVQLRGDSGFGLIPFSTGLRLHRLALRRAARARPNAGALGGRGRVRTGKGAL
jgi:hypothetical protein